MKAFTHPDALLVPFVLRTLNVERYRQVKRHLHSCARCSKMLLQVKHDVADFAMALEPQTPPPVIRESLLQAINEVPRLADCLAPLALLLGVPEKQSALLLEAIDDVQAWRYDSIQVARLDAALPTGTTIWKLGRNERLCLNPSKKSSAPSLLVIQGFCHDGEGLLIGPTEMRDLQGEANITACGPIDTICATVLGTDLHSQ